MPMLVKGRVCSILFIDVLEIFSQGKVIPVFVGLNVETDLCNRDNTRGVQYEVVMGEVL